LRTLCQIESAKSATSNDFDSVDARSYAVALVLLIVWEMHPRHETNLPHADITAAIIGAFYEVHRELGHGFSELVYRRAVAIVLRQNGLDAIEERMISVTFRGSIIGTFYADIVVAGVVLVEVKVSSAIDKYAEVQLLNYLKAAGGGVGLLLNFGREATYKRFAMGAHPTNSLPALRMQQR
jgi:GxxExxY protein